MPKAQKLAAKTNPKFVALDKVTPFKDITTYNNYYEFGTDKARSGAKRAYAAAAAVDGVRSKARSRIRRCTTSTNC